MMELPEIPPADGFTSVRNEHQRFEGVRDFWLRTSILAYGELCVRAERERCAKLCEKESVSYANAQGTAKTVKGGLAFEAMGVGASNCAVAIRKP